MIEPHLDFRRLKATVSIEHVLAQSGLDDGLRRRGNRLVGPCPIHGGDNPVAFVVSLEKNTWYCFTRCAAGGDVVELVRRMRRCGYHEAARYLASLVGGHAPGPPPPSASSSTKVDFRPFTKRLPLDPLHPFLTSKGIRPSTARCFEAGVYHGQGFLHGCVAVRIHDTDGRPLGYAGRRLDRYQALQFGKWKLPPRLPKSRLLYNFHRLFLSNTPAPLVIVECPWGVMRLAQLHLPAVALLGTSLSEHQRPLLDRFSKVILLLDGDQAGSNASSSIQHLLEPLTEVLVIHLPDGLDPDDLSDRKLRERLDPFFSS